jgi:hypothetical protein
MIFRPFGIHHSNRSSVESQVLFQTQSDSLLPQEERPDRIEIVIQMHGFHTACHPTSQFIPRALHHARLVA